MQQPVLRAAASAARHNTLDTRGVGGTKRRPRNDARSNGLIPRIIGNLSCEGRFRRKKKSSSHWCSGVNIADLAESKFIVQLLLLFFPKAEKKEVLERKKFLLGEKHSGTVPRESFDGACSRERA